jgi:hypothetical protein
MAVSSLTASSLVLSSILGRTDTVLAHKLIQSICFIVDSFIEKNEGVQYR